MRFGLGPATWFDGDYGKLWTWTTLMETYGNQYQPTNNQPRSILGTCIWHIVRVRCSGFGGLYTEIDRPIMNRDTSACSGIGITNSENKELLALPTLSTAQA